jgi:hypothetical protein
VLSTRYGSLSDNPKMTGGERYGFWRGCLVSLSKDGGAGADGGYGGGGQGGRRGTPCKLVQPFSVYGAS